MFRLDLWSKYNAASNNVYEGDGIRGQRSHCELVLNRMQEEEAAMILPLELSFRGVEKTADIEIQRRSIRNLGKPTLKKLILRIFRDIRNGDYKDGNIAKAFGLSKATFSRFAGSSWYMQKSNIPDLWINTAYVLSNNSDFKQIAVETGFWEQVKAVVEKTNKS